MTPSRPAHDDASGESPPARSRRRFFTLPAALGGVALAAALAALGVALSDGGSSEPAAVRGSATPTAAEQPAAGGEAEASEGTGSSASTAEAVYAAAADGVVEVEASGAGSSEPPFGPGGDGGGALGSGFVVDDEGHVVTNEHVVDGASSVTVAFADGTELSARVVGTDPSSDVALLQVDASAVDLHPLELGSSDDLVVGQDVYAIGNPYGLERSLTAGIVSALDRQIQAPNGYSIGGAIQTDAAINSGNSGGPLLDADGRVVGITAQIESRTGGNIGIGYAIPIDLVREVVSQLESGGAVERAYLGVTIEELTPALAESLGVESGAGVHVSQVREGSPAAEAGLEQGDVIVSVDGDDVSSPEELTALIGAKKPGDRVELELVRDGETTTVTATLGTRPESVEG